MKSLVMFILVVVAALFGGAQTVIGQITTAQLNGTVTDEAGAFLPNATITLQNPDTGLTRETVSDKDGGFAFTTIPPGRYDLTVTVQGFSTYKSAVNLTVGENATVPVNMKVGNVSETVTVSEEQLLTEPTRTSIGQAIEVRKIEDLPIIGRNFVDFVLLSPGVAIGRGDVGGGNAQEPNVGVGAAAVTRLSFGGQSERGSLIQVDGLDAVHTVTSLQRAVPSQEAVKEFRVLNTSYAAELGRGYSGFVNVITKSGTNELHGSGYYFGVNDALNSRNILQNQENDTLRQNQFGMTLGGPIKRDKLFLFGNYEGQRRAEANQFAQVVTTNLAAINNVRRSFGLRQETLNLLRTNDYNGVFTRADWQATQKHQVVFTYNFLKSETLGFLGGGGRAAPTSSTARNNFLNDQFFTTSIISLLTSNWVNEGRFQVARRTFDFPSITNEPALEIPNVIIMGKSTSDLDYYQETSFQLKDHLSHTRQNHNFKVGADYNRYRDDVVGQIFLPARVIFPSLAGFLGQAPFTGPTAVLFQFPVPLGVTQRAPLPTDFSRALTTAEEPLVRFKTNHSAFGTFFQDQWQATPKLTMNYGLRYDVSHYQNILDVKPDNNDFQPRIGVAYAVSPKIVLRAGAGIFADASRRAPIGGLQAQAANFGFPDTGATPASLAATSDYSNAPSNGSQFFVAGAGPATAAARNFLSTGQFPSTTGALVLVVKYNKKQPTTYANQLSGEASFQLTKDLGLSLGYLFVGTHFLPTFARNLNAKPSGVNVAGQQLFAGRIDPRYLFVGSFAKTSNSVYHGGTAVLQKRFSRNFSVDVNYTYSKSIDDCGQCFFDNFSDAAVNPFNQSLERAISNQHVAHRFVSTFLVQSPQSWKNPIAKDFEFGGVIKLESPRYFTIYAGADANGDGNPLNDRLGLLGRNTLKGDNFRQVDIRLSRTFPLREKMRLKVLFDVANLFNTENINTINSVWGSFNPAVPPIASFKTPRTVFPARQIQYGLKLNF